MKIEIEISEAELAAALQERVSQTVKARAGQWGVDTEIKARLDRMWTSALDRLVEAALADSGKLKERITEEIEKKLRRKIAALMNAGDAGAIQ